MDRLLFEMPYTLEMFMPAMAAVQSLCDQLEKQKKPDYELTVVASNPFSFFYDCFRKVTVWAEGDLHVNKRGYDLAFAFTELAALKMAETSKMHVAKAFGTFIGADPVNDYPTVLGDLSAIKEPEPTRDVLVWNLSPDLEEKIKEFCQQKDWTFTHATWCTIKQGKVRELYKLLAEHKMIVGERSGGTYLASSLKRKVVEIYPTDRHKNWLSKWANPNYFMIYEDAPELRTITRAMEVAWNRKPEWVDSSASNESMVRR